MPTNARKAPADDPQLYRLYDWEDGWREWNLSNLSLTECRAIVERACSAYGIDPPTVSQHRKLSYSYYDPNTYRISFQAKGKRKLGGEAGGKNYAQVLHEVAHAIVDQKCARYQDHGPTFVGLYLKLLVQAKVAPASALYHSARKAGLKWRRS